MKGAVKGNKATAPQCRIKAAKAVELLQLLIAGAQGDALHAGALQGRTQMEHIKHIAERHRRHMVTLAR